MKNLIATLFLALTLNLSFAQEAPKAEADTINAEWVESHYDKREVKIKMRDGINLYTVIYEPKDKTVKHPILMTRTCYSAGPYGEKYAPIWRSETEYVRNGYIIVTQDVRGKNKSEGDFEDIRPFVENKTKKKVKGKIQIDEASDTYDTADWLVKNTNCNGNIGVYGISYPGFYATNAALSGHPAIKAVSPQAPVTDWYRGDDAHHNGAFFYMDMYNFQFWFEKMMSNKNIDLKAIKAPETLVRNDAYTDFLNAGAVKNLSATYGDSIQGWNDVINHPDLDEYWETHNISYHCHDVKPAVMVIGGLFDAEDCYGAFRTYEAIRQQSPSTELYLVDGPWSHGGWSRGATVQFGHVRFAENMTSEWYIQNIEYPFFAYYLEGKGEKPQPGAKVYDTGSCEWKYYPNGWDNKVATTPYYLAANGTLSTTATEGSMSYISDPSKPVPYQMNPDKNRTITYLLDDQRFAAQRPDVMVYQTEPMTEELSLAGEVEVELEVSLTTTDADFVVKVIDVFPADFAYDNAAEKNRRAPMNYNMSGYQMLVRGDIMRGRYRNSFSAPEAFVPGEKTKVKFTLPSLCHTFKPGHRLMIQVQSTWFPLVDRNPQKFCNIYTCDDSDFQKSEITIYGTSCVKLPVKK